MGKPGSMGLAILCHPLCLTVTSSAQHWAEKMDPDFTCSKYDISQMRPNGQENEKHSLVEIFILLPEASSLVAVTFALPLSHWSWNSLGLCPALTTLNPDIKLKL